MNIEDFINDWNSTSPTIEVKTSGSTGLPKTICVEKSRMMASAQNTCRFLHLREGDTALLCMPLDFIAGKMMVVRALTCGLKLINVPPSSHPLKNIDKAPDFAAMVPLQVYNSLSTPHETDILKHIRHLIIGGGAIDTSLENKLKEFPHAVWSTYGMTETLSHIALRRINGPDASSWYTPFDNVSICLNHEGCLVIDAPEVCPQRLTTNDIAVIDSDGRRFQIVGRKDNVVCSGGLKIHIEEVEAKLKDFVSVPFLITKTADRRLGQAVTMLYEGDSTTAYLLEETCRKTLPRHWVPRHFLAVTQLPFTATGKPARAEAEQMANQLTNNKTLQPYMEINTISSDNLSDKLRLPAEWERQKAVQLTWPHADTDWKDTLDDITKTYVEMAVEIAKREKLIVVTPHPDEVRAIIEDEFKKRELGEKAYENLRIVKIDSDDTWARDHGFISLTGDGQTELLDFRFNGWGGKFEAEKDNLINRQLHKKGIIRGNYRDCNDFVLEGGSIESDGDGTIFTTSGCLLAPGRNQPMTQDEIEQTLLQRLHAKRIQWIDYGNLIGDDTDGHIDTLVRIAPADTLLYVGCDDENDPQYAELKKMEEQLRTFTTRTGRCYRLLRLPMPRPIYRDGERLPATYANFLVINDAVLYPTYGQPDLDDEAAQTIADAFPDRDIIGIDCQSVIVQHGSLHCCTMQFPKEIKKT